MSQLTKFEGNYLALRLDVDIRMKNLILAFTYPNTAVQMVLAFTHGIAPRYRAILDNTSPTRSRIRTSTPPICLILPRPSVPLRLDLIKKLSQPPVDAACTEQVLARLQPSGLLPDLQHDRAYGALLPPLICIGPLEPERNWSPAEI